MGTEAWWVPYAIATVGAGTAAYETDRTAKKQDRAAALGIRQQAERQRQADQRVNRELQQIKQSDAEAERAAANEQFVQQLQRNRAVAGGALPNVAGASDRFAQDLEKSTEDSDSMAERVAALMARIDAPTLQRQREGRAMGRLATDLGQIARLSAGDDFLAQLRLRGIRENPWVMAGASIAQGAGSSMASSGYGTTGAGTTRVLQSGKRVDLPVYNTPPYTGALA